MSGSHRTPDAAEGREPPGPGPSLSVAMLSHLASPVAPTGAEHSLGLLAAGLRARGHRVRVAAPGPWALSARLRERGVEVETLPCRVCWLAYYEPRPTTGALLRWVRYALPDPGRSRLRRWLSRARPDVVHVNCLPHLAGARIASELGLPVIWHLREILPAGPRRRWWSERLRRNATCIVAVSEAVADWVRAEGLSARLEVVPNGVALPRADPDRAAARRRLDLPADGCLVGLLGQLLPHKGVLELVRAGQAALGRAPGLRFVVAGSGPPAFVERVRAEIRSQVGAERFHLVPPQPTGEHVVAACDVVCLTTVTPDPFPRSVLEAMAAGRPVAAFRSGGVAEMVRDGRTGLLVDVGDVEGLADALVRLAREPELRTMLGQAGAARAREEFSEEKHVARMETLLRRAADVPGAAARQRTRSVPREAGTKAR